MFPPTLNRKVTAPSGGLCRYSIQKMGISYLRCSSTIPQTVPGRRCGPVETHAHVLTRAAQLAAAEEGGARTTEASRGRRAHRAPTAPHAQGETPFALS